MSSFCTLCLHLRHGNVDQGFGCGVHYIEEAHNGGPVVGNGHALAVVDQLVHAARAQCGPHRVRNGLEFMGAATFFFFKFGRGWKHSKRAKEITVKSYSTRRRKLTEDGKGRAMQKVV